MISPDVLPHALDDFEAPASAGAWDVRGAVLWMASEPPAPAWDDHDWLAPLGYRMAGQIGGGDATPVCWAQYRRRRAA